MKRLLKAFLIVLIIQTFLYSGNTITDVIKNSIDSKEIFNYVEYLSSSFFEGRLTGTKGFIKATKFVERRLKSYGLTPLFDKGYLQSFHVDYSKVYSSSFMLFLDKEKKKIKGEYFKNYYPLGCSGKGKIKGKIVFVGTGITDEDEGYDDYKGVDVKGKIVLVLSGVLNRNYNKFRSHGYKIENAKKHGAIGMLLVRGALGVVSCKFSKDFPAVSITEELANKILEEKKITVKEAKKFLKIGKNVSFETSSSAVLDVDSEGFKGKGYNIGAYIKGNDKRFSNEFIVIGAHLDHLGRWPVLIPGADDNASGASTLLSISKALSKLKGKTKRSIAVIFFSGEEMGLIGSEYFVQNLPSRIKKISYMINMDMVGEGNKIFVLGLKNFKEVESSFNEAKKELKLDVELRGNKVPLSMMTTGSDHGSFAKVGIPAVSVFSSGSKHHGYHTKEDTIYWITPKIMEDIGEIVTFTAFKLANR